MGCRPLVLALALQLPVAFGWSLDAHGEGDAARGAMLYAALTTDNPIGLGCHQCHPTSPKTKAVISGTNSPEGGWTSNRCCGGRCM